MRLRNIFQPVLKSVLQPMLGIDTGQPVSANARTYELGANTTQLIIDPLSDEIVGRWITPTQTHKVMRYAPDFRLIASAGRQFIAVPPEARGVGYGVSIATGPDATETSVPFTYTESTLASEPLRDSVDNPDTFVSSAASIAAYQGSVTVAANAGRQKNALLVRNDLPNVVVDTWTIANGAAVESATVVVDGVECYHISNTGTSNGINVRYQSSTGVVANNDRIFNTVKVRAVDSGDVGDSIIFTVYKFSGSGAVGKIYVPLTMAWVTYYIDVTYASDDVGVYWGFRKDGSTTAAELYVAEPTLQVVTGLSEIIPVPFYADTDDHWDENVPMYSLVDQANHMTTTAGGVASEIGKVFGADFRRPIGTLDPDNRYKQHQHIGVYAGIDV